MKTRLKTHWAAFRLAIRTVSAILLAWALGGCAGPRLEVVESPSQASVTLSQPGIRLTISPNSWDAYPSDLSRYYTPVQIHIDNDRADEIQVRYADFLAVDEARNQYRAVAPAEVARALFGSLGPYEDRARALTRRERPGAGLYAFHDPWWWSPYWPYPYGPPFYSPFYPYGYYGPAYPSPWPQATSYDILTLGLREGRVLPGARVEGFLFLQQATQKGNFLTFSWTPVMADGKPLPSLSTRFRIVR